MVAKEIITKIKNKNLINDYNNLFRNYIPKRFEQSLENEGDLNLANELDYIDFHMRKYITRFDPTMRILNKEIKNAAFAIQDDVFQIINEVEQDILHCELYELMPRLIKMKAKINKLFK